MLRVFQRKRKTLGATARVGERVGHPYVPWEASEAIAEGFLNTFDSYCTDNRLKPPNLKDEIVGGAVILPDAATGQPVPIRFVLAPSVAAFHETSLPATGLFDPNSNVVAISPTVGACKPRESWKNILLSVIRHELAHAGDTQLYIDNRILTNWMNQISALHRRGVSEHQLAKLTQRVLPKRLRSRGLKMLGVETPGLSKEETFCRYIRTSPEQNAFLTQVATELTLVGKRLRSSKAKGFKNPVVALREGSPTFREISNCLTPKQRERFLKMSARLWDKGDLPRADELLSGVVSSPRRKRQRRRGHRR